MTNRRYRIGAALIAAIACITLVLRLQDLSLRVMHGDEANQAHKFGRLLESGEYRYDPVEHHGPTLYYATLPVAWARGEKTFAETSDATYRSVPVIFSVAAIVLLVLLMRGLGSAEMIVAALLLAVSPAMYFYSRYYIQETLLACFTLAFIVFGWRYVNSRKWPWAVLAGASLGLMHATKETFVLAVAAALAAGGAHALFERRASSSWPDWKGPFDVRGVVLGGATAVLVSVLFFSSFFSNARGPLDSILTYATYLHRAGGAEMHDKPWHYYLHLLLYWNKGPEGWWSEGVIVIMAAVGAGIGIFRPGWSPAPGLARFLALYTLFLTSAYSIIAYKTPWCVLSFLTGMVLLAGVGIVAVVRHAPSKWSKAIVAIAMASGIVHLSSQTYRANYTYPAHWTNPYVYAHTGSSFLKLIAQINELAKVSPEGRSMLIRVYKPDGDYWPLPYYLRAYPNTGFHVSLDANMDASVIITSPGEQEALAPHLLETYQTIYAGFRPEMPCIVYIRQDVWELLLQSRG